MQNANKWVMYATKVAMKSRKWEENNESESSSFYNYADNNEEIR